MTRRAVLHFTTWYPEADDDPHGVFVAEHVRAASISRASAVVYMPWGAGPPSGHAWASPRDGAVPLRIDPCGRGLRSLPRMAVSALTAPAWAREHAGPVGVVHAHTLRAAVPALAVARRAQLPLVITEHATMLLGDPPMGLVARAIAKTVYPRAAVVLPVGPALEAAILQVAPRADTHLVANVVSSRILSERRRHVRRRGAAVIGSLEDRKRVDVAIEAWGRAGLDEPLHVIGDGPLRHELEVVATRAAPGRVSFHGAIPKERLAAIVASSRTVLVTSSTETFSVVAAEALCLGTPVVTTRCGGPEHFVSERDGIVVDRGVTADQLAAAIGDVVRHEWDHDSISARAVGSFSVESVARDLADVYDSVDP